MRTFYTLEIESLYSTNTYFVYLWKAHQNALSAEFETNSKAVVQLGPYCVLLLFRSPLPKQASPDITCS